MEKSQLGLSTILEKARLNAIDKPTTNNMTTPQTYATRAEAQKAIAVLDSGTYYLSHGEYERPDYTVRKLRNGDRYYIHVRRYFYAGTLHAKKSGALTIYDLDSI